MRGKWPDFRGFERVGRLRSEVERKRKGEGEVRFFLEIQSDNERRQRRRGEILFSVANTVFLPFGKVS